MPIPEMRDWFQVSNLGRVRSVRYTEVRLLKPRLIFGGPYLGVYMQRGGKVKAVRVHRLVAGAFVEGWDELREVAHINGNPLDNRAVNLMWATRAENQGHRYLHGTACTGETNSNSKLTWEIVREIRRRAFANGKLIHGIQTTLAKEFGVNQTTVHAVVHRRCWVEQPELA